MKVGQAIRTAIGYETRVRDLYLEAARQATDETGRRVLGLLAEEEQGHLDYLEQMLKRWQDRAQPDGVVDDGPHSRLPSAERVRNSFEKLKNLRVEKPAEQRKGEVEILKRVLQAELETSRFYKSTVEQLDERGRKLFEPFIDIEEGHVAIVQAQIDSLTGLGFWFDVQEFDLEAG